MIDILKELHQNAVDFAYEANSQRAFPDARDGLKPGQRACLWEFYSKGYSSNKPHVKSAKISGGVIGSWWPHGDQAIYDTFARMSQPWINNVPEVDWHGANGNQIISSEVASARYTEARLSAAAEEGLFQGIKKNNVPMILNFSEDAEWPEVLPAIMPRLLVNGCQGIGYTLANQWPMYNLGELVNVIYDYVSTNKLDYNELYPDFPTGGVIINKDELAEICATGRGRIVVRAKTEIKDNVILITELPYQAYVEPILETIRDLVEKEEIKGIANWYNKSDKTKLLIEIECDTNPNIVLQQLFKLTDLQKTFNPNQYALVGKTPILLNLQKYLDIYVEHNLNCINKEAEFDLAKATDRLEIVDGLLKALEDIDNIIALIKQSKDSADAKANLVKVYAFTENQAKAIVDMRLGRLAHLEKVELNEEKNELVATVTECNDILTNITKRQEIFLNRLSAFVKKFAKPRKTEVMQIAETTKEEKEIANVEPEKCVVVMTKGGLIKRIPITSFRTQKRNTKGVKTQDDVTTITIRTNTIDSLMIFSDKGKMYRLLVNDIPEGTNVSRGASIEALVNMDADEKPSTIYSIYHDTKDKYVLFVTKNGVAKRTLLSTFVDTKKKSGIVATSVREDDELTSVTLCDDEDILFITHEGYCLRVPSSEISLMTKAALGSKGIALVDGDYVVAAMPIRDADDDVAVFTEEGIGKRVKLNELNAQRRGGRGVYIYKPTPSTGKVAAAALVNDDDIVLINGKTKSICLQCNEIPVVNRTGMGSAVLKDNKIVSVTKI